MAKKKRTWELTVDDLPKAFREYPEVAKQVALRFYCVALDNGFADAEASDLALAAIGRKWQKGDDGVWNYLGESAIDEAKWSAAYVNDLPDSSFAYVEPGGEKDDDGKTTPRSKRNLPYKDADGAVDLPHLRNALARLDQTDAVPASKREGIRTKLEKALDASKEAAPDIRYTGDVLRESAIRETVAFDFDNGDVQILEAEADGFKRIVAPLLCVGFSKNKGEITESHVESRRGKFYPRYYPTAELERVAPLCEGLTVYVGFDEHNDQVDVPKELGVYEGSHFARGAVRGAVKVFKDQNWVVERLACSPRAFGGLSIEGGAGHRYGYVDNTEAAVVQGLKVARARLVKNPAAAGGIEGIRESDEGGEPMELTLQQLKESHPAVYEAARREFITEADVKTKDADIKRLTEAVATKDEEIKTLNAKVHEAESVALVEAAFPRTKDANSVEVHVFPDKARAALHAKLKGVTDKVVVEAAVKEMADILAEATGGVKVSGAGMSGGRQTAEPAAIAEARADLGDFFGVEKPKPEAAVAAK